MEGQDTENLFLHFKQTNKQTNRKKNNSKDKRYDNNNIKHSSQRRQPSANLCQQSYDLTFCFRSLLVTLLEERSGKCNRMKALNKLYLQINQTRWGLQVEGYPLKRRRPPASPLLQLPACSLLSNNFDCGKRFWPAKQKQIKPRSATPALPSKNLRWWQILPWRGLAHPHAQT